MNPNALRARSRPIVAGAVVVALALAALAAFLLSPQRGGRGGCGARPRIRHVDPERRGRLRRRAPRGRGPGTGAARTAQAERPLPIGALSHDPCFRLGRGAHRRRADTAARARLHRGRTCSSPSPASPTRSGATWSREATRSSPPPARRAPPQSLRAVGVDARRWLVDPEDRGEENVAGVTTTHYSSALDLGRVLDDLDRLVRRAAPQIDRPPPPPLSAQRAEALMPVPPTHSLTAPLAPAEARYRPSGL